MRTTSPIRLMHFVYSFHMGGLENVVIQLINRLPPERYQHCLVSLTDMGDFADRIRTPGVERVCLHKTPGHAIPLYPSIYKLFRRYRPHVLHTCNLAALEVVPLAWLARVPVRIHAEHGWDASDPKGQNVKYQRLRKLYRPFVSHYVSVSQDLDQYLARRIGVPADRRTLIANGVDTAQFSPPAHRKPHPEGCPFEPGRHWLIGTVGRLQTVKNQPLLAHAFVRLLDLCPTAREHARLVIVGEGPLRAEIERILSAAGVSHLAWLPGARADVATVLQSLDCFVLPSETEGTSCTLQEAMSCGLPSVATAVGGTPDLLTEEITGRLVPSDDVDAMAHALMHYMLNPQQARDNGRAARAQAQRDFGMDAMVAHYDQLFQRC